MLCVDLIILFVLSPLTENVPWRQSLFKSVCPLLYPQDLEQCLTYSKCSENSCWMNEQTVDIFKVVVVLSRSSFSVTAPNPVCFTVLILPQFSCPHQSCGPSSGLASLACMSVTSNPRSSTPSPMSSLSDAWEVEIWFFCYHDLTFGPLIIRILLSACLKFWDRRPHPMLTKSRFQVWRLEPYFKK